MRTIDHVREVTPPVLNSKDKEMVCSILPIKAKQRALLKAHGYKVAVSRE